MLTYLKRIIIFIIFILESSFIFIAFAVENTIKITSIESTNTNIQNILTIKNRKYIINQDKIDFEKRVKIYINSIWAKFDIKLIDIIYDKATKKWLDPYLIIALIKKESTFRNNSYNAGSIWYLQVSKYPVIWYNKIHGTRYTLNDLYKARVNLEIWIDYLSQKMKIYQNEHLALMSYNGGDWYLRKMLKSGVTKSRYSKYITSLRDKIKSIKI